MMKVRKMSRLLAKYDPYDVEDDWDAEAQAENFSEDLSCIIGSIFSNYDKVYIKGAVGRWDGPHWGEIIIDDPKELREFICNEDIIELSLIDDEEDEDVSELQRYSSQWSLNAQKGDMIIKQWHHDGCNIFIMKPMKGINRLEFRPEDLPW